VKVLEVDVARKRIMLSIKQTQEFNRFKSDNRNNRLQPQKETTMSDALKNLQSKFKK